MLQCPQCGERFDLNVTACPRDGTPLRADSTIAVSSTTLKDAAAKFLDDAPVNNDPLIGQILDDKYRLESLLGTGGMGSVYRATHLLIDRSVAVKVLNPRLVTDAAAKERLRREARAAGRLRHTGAVAVTDFGQTTNGIVYIVMELLEGISLREMLAARKAIEPGLAVALMTQTASAVAAAHNSGIIHRDLKPGNIFIIERERGVPLVKVLDFGIAKVAQDADANDANALMTLTETGILIGTPRYMSPEQCDGQPLTPASDVYSLGVIFYEMLTGVPPFSGATPLAIALQHSAQTPRPPGELNSLVPLALEALVLHALAKRPAERPSDASAFNRELHQAARDAGLDDGFGFASPTSEIKHEDDSQALREIASQTASTKGSVASETVAYQAANTFGGNRSDDFTDNSIASNATIALTSSGTPPAAPATTSQPHAAEEQTTVMGQARQVLHRVQHQRSWQLGALAGLLLLVIVSGYLLFANRSETSPATKDEAARDANPNNNAPALNAANVNRDDESIGRSLATSQPEANANIAAPSREPQTAAEFYERASYYFSRRDYARAAADCRRAIELQPDFPLAHNRLGWMLVLDGKFRDGAQAFRRAIELRGGDFPAARYNLGYALQRQGYNRGALEAYAEAIENRRGFYPDAHFQQGMIHLAQNRDAEATEALRRAIEQNDGNDYEANFALGVALARQDKPDEAEAAFRRAIEQRDGSYPDANYNLGLLYQNNNRPDDAIREFESYLQQQPKAFNRRLVENSLRRLRAGQGGR
ncbi:MAG: serine/threonine-protein kinase [Pyrinomonadaceae bacterium MAG19_C2-C3]|nr:serine/threonine-protein kinase [Pyrinomonadaceae bacterium MAG19_C2-C3]